MLVVSPLTPPGWVLRCPWARRLTLTATDQLAVALYGWLRPKWVNVCINHCKSLWLKASDKCPECKTVAHSVSFKSRKWTGVFSDHLCIQQIFNQLIDNRFSFKTTAWWPVGQIHQKHNKNEMYLKHKKWKWHYCFLTSVTSMTLIAASWPVLTWRPWRTQRMLKHPHTHMCDMQLNIHVTRTLFLLG